MATAVIIDYGMGNVASVAKALNFLRIDNVITDDPAAIREAKYVILPGVGSFRQGMDNLREKGLDTLLKTEVVAGGKPFLGICLGMQLIAVNGTEPEPCQGLGWIPGTVKRIEEPEKRIPHLGWNNITVNQSGIWQEADNKDFYFIHSYHFEVENPAHIAATVNYGHDYVAAIQKDHIFAMQFHPEKSQQAGLDLLKRFFEHYA